MNKDIKIPITSLEIYDILKPGYTGGHVDVYRPYGENMYCYDVNSLYPSVIARSVRNMNIQRDKVLTSKDLKI